MGTVLDLLLGWFVDVWQFGVASVVVIVHFCASLLSTLTKSWSTTGSFVGNSVRKSIDWLALNVGYARNEDADGRNEGVAKGRDFLFAGDNF